MRRFAGVQRPHCQMPSRRSDSDYEAPSEDAYREASGEDENKGKGKGKHKRGGRRGGRTVCDRQFALQASSPPPIGSDSILVNRRADQAANLTTIAAGPTLSKVAAVTGKWREVHREVRQRCCRHAQHRRPNRRPRRVRAARLFSAHDRRPSGYSAPGSSRHWKPDSAPHHG